MKNFIINNQGVSAPNNPNPVKKTKLEIQIASLKSQEQQISKKLKNCESKLKKANNLANCLATTEKFGKQFLNEVLEKEKSQEQPDNWCLEYLLKNKVEFALKFAIGSETFAELIRLKIGSEAKCLRNKLESMQNQIQHCERKFARLEARRQGKTLLECEYNKSLGCLGSYQCANCRSNYSVANHSPQLATNQLREGAK